jgi:hypothetical protein
VNVAQLKLAVQDATGGVQPTVSEGDNITIEKTGDAATGYDYKISANLSGVATKDSGLKFGADSGYSHYDQAERTTQYQRWCYRHSKPHG